MSWALDKERNEEDYLLKNKDKNIEIIPKIQQ